MNGDSQISTTDVIAIQRFALGIPIGIANVGKYQFTPVSRTYPGVVTDQTGQNYDALVFGDVASTFVYRPGGGGDEMSSSEIPATVAAIALPEVTANQSQGDIIAAVKTSAIDAKRSW